jgi:hypothetical protein
MFLRLHPVITLPGIATVTFFFLLLFLSLSLLTTPIAIHAVDKVHNGTGDSSVMYIPACPVTEANAEYVKRQRSDFLDGVPPPDFPGGIGESKHVGRANLKDLQSYANDQGMRAFGFGEWNAEEENLNFGQRRVLKKANEILGF